MWDKLKSNWATKKSDAFFIARLSLTKWYLIILASLIVGFTYLTFQAKESAYVRVYTVVSNYNQDQNKLIELQDNYEKFNQRFRQRILWLDAVLMIWGGLASWWLAGRTLKPIALMMEEQGSFAGDVSHGLRTPLASMRLQIDAFKLKQQRVSRATEELLADFLSEITHMSRIVEGVLVLTRTSTNRATKISQKTNLTLLVSQVKTDMQPLALAKKQKLNIEIPLAETMIKGDFDQWLQVMIILIDNAIKYTPVKGKVNVLIEENIGFVKIVVSDNGPGIAKNEQKKIFETYYRGKQKTKIPGAGLGLAIAAKIVKANDGTIRSAENKPQGAKFTVKAQIAKVKVSK